ncbi:MAG: GntR family transcriptional regulator, partial [Chloroflexota bacterium]
MALNQMHHILTPTLKRSLSDEVADRIREAITSGKLEPGARLREVPLAGSLRVSRGPVREALTQLEREGLVIVYHHRGACVARLAADDLEEVYSLRRAIEPLAMRRMMSLGDAARLDDLQRVVNELAAACARGITTQEAAELDVRFHDIIFQASQHRRLYDCWQRLQSQIHIMLLTRHVGTQGFRKSIVKRHQELLDAMRSGKEHVALAALESH